MKEFLYFTKIFIFLTLVLPTTLFYAFGLLISVILVFSQGYHLISLVLLLIIPGYSLYTLWWLGFRHNQITIKEIPVKIWFGLVVGMIISTIALVITLLSIQDLGVLRALGGGTLYGAGTLFATTLCIIQIKINSKNK